ILVDKMALKEANVDYEDSTISLKLNGTTVRTILKKILGDLSLTYSIRDEAIQVTTPERARQHMVARAYYVGDLLTTNLDPRLDFFTRRFLMLQNATMLMEMIKMMVDPGSWDQNGGPTIAFNEASMTIVVKGPAEMHFKIGSLGGR